MNLSNKLEPTNIFPIYMIIGTIFAISIGVIINYILNQKNKIERNIHHYSYFDETTNKFYFHRINTFVKYMSDVYMSDSIKSNIIDTITEFNSTNNYYSIRLILSGVDGIGKNTLIEAIATTFNYGIIHFPKDNYTEKMIVSFFHSLDKYVDTNNIISFDIIDFNTLSTKNKEIYNLLVNFITKNKNKNIFIFVFNDIKDIPMYFSTHLNINQHYHLSPHINYIMKLISEYIDDNNKLVEIKNKFLNINHKITP